MDDDHLINIEEEADDADHINEEDVEDDDGIIERTYHTGDDTDAWNRDDEPSFILIIDPNSTVISEEALWGCRKVVRVIFHNDITRIEEYVFRDCENLRRTNELPDGLIHLGFYAFCETPLEEIFIPKNVRTIGYSCFESASIQTVIFDPDANVEEFGDFIFYGCEQLRSVVLPHRLRFIPRWFLLKCPSLTECEIPATVDEIGEGGFAESGLRSIDLSENVRHIQSNAFRSCPSLTTIAIRSSSSYNFQMEEDVFRNYPSLSTIKVFPWLWPTLFESMNGNPQKAKTDDDDDSDDENEDKKEHYGRDFIFLCFRRYHIQIFNFGTLISNKREEKRRRKSTTAQE